MRSAVATLRGLGSPRAYRTGIGLRIPHIAEVAIGAPSAAWFEVHPENFIANPHARELLLAISERYPISVHTVGLSIGSADGVDRNHLARVRRLVNELDPMFVSGHLAWSTYQGKYLNDLLPLPYDDETLRIVAAHLHVVQDALGRAFLVENPASYVGFGSSTLTEVQFLSALVAAAGCRLLCDVSNIFVSAKNMGFDGHAYIDAFPAHAVDELHLGGFTPEADEAGDEILIDTHGAAIAEPVWALYAHALRRFGSRPTLIEWDNDIPQLATLVVEAERADAVADEIAKELRPHAAAR